jgi:aspartyl-tRNA(Asn)/glutamyl-tRNA(Gln) amidotransferase subunit A
MNIRTHLLPESITDFHFMIATRRATVLEVVQLYLSIIKLKNPDTNAYLEVYEEEALEKAKACDKAIEGKDETAVYAYIWRHKMFGIPFAIKDNILLKGKKISAGSKILENYTASYTATSLERILDAGGICLGRVNMDEFAMGGSTENSAYGVTKNPLNLAHVSGGSSGGSAAAMAMDGCLFALGSDTGGSVRQPASFCGVMGLKPTYGSVSRHGLMAMASSFDVIGVLAKNVEDTEAVFEAMKGLDTLDATTHKSRIVDAHETLPRRGMKVAIPRDVIFTKGVSKEVQHSIEKSIEKLQRKGVQVVDISLPLMKHALALYYILVPAEVSSNMARYDGVRYGRQSEGVDLLDTYMKTRGELLGAEVKRRIMLGTYILSEGYHDAYYTKAMALRTELTESLKEVLKTVDAIMLPTTPDVAFKIGEKVTDPLALYLSDVFTVTANLTGLPAISVPFVDFVDEHGDRHFGTESKLPLGIQFIGKVDGETDIFALGKVIQ